MLKFERDLQEDEDEYDEMQTSTGDGTQSTSRSGTSRRGFASMSAERRREIAAKGGRSQGKRNNPGNFANNREKAAAAGRIGGQRSNRRSDEDSEE